MRLISLLIIILLLFHYKICLCQSIPSGKYFGQSPPGLTAEIFAPNIISLNNRYEYILVFSADSRECVFGVTNSTWSFFTLLYTKMADDSSWIDPIAPPFLGNGDGLLPAYTHDGNKIFFVSSRPSYPPFNIWYSEREDTLWNAPIKLASPVNTNSDEFGLSLTINETLYFTSNRSGGFGQHDIYRAVLVDSQYTLVENLGSPINTQYNEASPFITPDGSYLIFESNQPGGYGQVDLYVSFFKDSIWTKPHNLGPEVNTDMIDDGPFVSPDGKYLFFNRRESWVTNVQTDIYWIDANVIFDTSSTGILKPRSRPKEFRLNQNYPNPFNPSTQITYELPKPEKVRMEVFNLIGQKVNVLLDNNMPPGSHEINFSSEGLPSGVYLYRIKAGKFQETRKMIMIR